MRVAVAVIARFAAVICLLAIVQTIAATRDEGVPDDEYIAYADDFSQYTVRVAAQTGDEISQAGTATLLSDHWAITAAHVVSSATGCVVGGHVSSEIVIHPMFRPEAVGFFDIALIRVREPFGRRFYPTLSTGDEKAGDLCSVVGFGHHGTMRSGYEGSDGRLRAGTTRIGRIDGLRIICSISRLNNGPLPFGISPGDSGGPLFCRGKLCGVNSFTMADSGVDLRSREGEEQGFARVSAAMKWIEDVMK